MTDRELLEAAAKAVGMEVWFPRMNGGKGENGERIIFTPCHTEKTGKTVEWSPLTDDGDALRLAVSLGMFDGGNRDYLPMRAQEISDGHDPYTATRRAIVRAAASLSIKLTRLDAAELDSKLLDWLDRELACPLTLHDGRYLNLGDKGVRQVISEAMKGKT